MKINVSTKPDQTYVLHPLSAVPGGRKLLIEFESGKSYLQQNCHMPKKYIDAVLKASKQGPIRKAYYDGLLIYANPSFC